MQILVVEERVILLLIFLFLQPLIFGSHLVYLLLLSCHIFQPFTPHISCSSSSLLATPAATHCSSGSSWLLHVAPPPCPSPHSLQKALTSRVLTSTVTSSYLGKAVILKMNSLWRVFGNYNIHISQGNAICNSMEKVRFLWTLGSARQSQLEPRVFGWQINWDNSYEWLLMEK